MSSNNIKHLLLVGSSGVGKSTIVKYLTGEDVKTSNSSESCTKKMTMYSINETLKILDTVGCEDSSGKPTENILQDILKYIGPTNSFCSKIIWVVGNPTERRLPELQKQAKWINKLTSNDAIWSSVIIIGRQFNSDIPFSGALGCIKKEGSNIKPICKRLHLLDLCSKDDMAVIGFGNLQFEKRIKHGCLFTKELKGWLLNELNKISFCSIGFRKKHKGTKVYYHYGSKTFCHHGEKILCHYRGKQFEHHGNKKFYHYKNNCPGRKIFRHYGEKTYYHYGSKEKEWYHYGRYKYTATQAVGAVLGNILWFGTPNFSSEMRDKMYGKYWSCCDNRYEDSEGCRSRFSRYSCCGSLNENSPPCTFHKWTCCDNGDEYSQGCKFREWDCCNNGYEYSEGCKFKKWDCCNNEDEYSQGCKFKKWICCENEEENSKGCKFKKWECCNSYNEDSTGCKFKKWTCCENKQQNADGCRFKEWTCCKNDENHSGCTVYAVI